MRRAARLLALVGPLLMVLALSKFHAAVVADPPYDYSGSARFGWSLAYAAALAAAAYGAGLPDLPKGWRSTLIAAVAASAAAALSVSAVQLVGGDALLPRFVVFGAALGLVPVHLVLGAVSQRGRQRDEGRDRVALIGSGEDVDRLVAELDQAPERPAVLAAHLNPQQVRAGTDPLEKPLVMAVIEAQASVVVLDRAAMADERIVEQASLLHEAGIRVRTLVEFYEEWLGKLPMSELERASLFFDIGEIHGIRYGRLKRLADLTGAVAGVLVLMVATPLVVIGNLVANRGPLLYRQTRVGRGGRTFEILKFRTMVAGEPGTDDARWTTENDPRVTRFGRLLRVSHLDELPQMVNILRGDLSLVGPRPEQPRYVAELSAKLPFYGMRHLVRPGLTGWAQVKYGYAGDDGDALEKLQYEFFYLEHQSLRFDARVLGRTVRSVAGAQGKGR